MQGASWMDVWNDSYSRVQHVCVIPHSQWIALRLISCRLEATSWHFIDNRASKSLLALPILPTPSLIDKHTLAEYFPVPPELSVLL